ncbi:MAG: hypothetical protein GX025_03860 [Clostridiales bacterium]|nr:hypothetical protein [Clostridiales bacterium]
MPLDAITISALAEELSGPLTGAKIDKVQQPERDIIILSLRTNGQNLKLLLSSGTGTARVHISTQHYENPKAPPMFCMLLRKHIVGARISRISQPDMERLLCFELDTLDEMGVETKKSLIVEMMGRNSNIILTGPEGHIIDCLRRVDGDMSKLRLVMPGLIYRLPPKQEKADFFCLDSEDRQRLWDEAEGEKLSDKWLLESFSGLSPLICRELSFLAFDDVSKHIGGLSQEERQAFSEEMEALCKRVEQKSFKPTMLFEEEKPYDFSFMPIFQYEMVMESKEYPDFSTLLEEFYTRRAKRELMQRKSHSLHKMVKSAYGRTSRKLETRQRELSETEGRDEKKLYGELITANMYRIKKGDRVLIADNYYSDKGEKIEIPLDPLKTPQQNAAKYFRDYNKAKTAREYL